VPGAGAVATRYLPGVIDIALKEWRVVCRLLAAGRCALLLRKGGVHEEAGPGRFRLEHDRFALFPAWEHENLDWIKPGFLDALTPDEAGEPCGGGAEPAWIEIEGYGQVARIWEVPSRAAFDRLDDLHPWTAPQIDMRFDYKPERPLYLLAVRAYALREVKVIPNRRAFAGCRSWVPLEAEDQVEETGAGASMSDADFAAVVGRVEGAFEG